MRLSLPPGCPSEATTSVSLLLFRGNSSDMARILMLFSGHHHHHHGYHDVVAGPSSPERVFECKTCNRQFPSFQALGGHSHKKPRLAEGAEPPKPKVHCCSICGLEFAVGQALGGHMRRHHTVEAAGEGLGLSPSRRSSIDEILVEEAPEGEDGRDADQGRRRRRVRGRGIEGNDVIVGADFVWRGIIGSFLINRIAADVGGERTGDAERQNFGRKFLCRVDRMDLHHRT